MPDKKISELVNLTSLAADDEFVVVDAGANATKRSTYSTLSSAVRGDIVDGDMPAGSIVQVVSFTTNTEVVSTTSTYIDTGLTASITPTSATNKILVLFSQHVVASTSRDAAGAPIRLLRNGSIVYRRDRLNAWGLFSAHTGSTAATIVGDMSGTYLDSPATTSSVTYKIQSRSWDLTGGSVKYQEGNVAESSLTLLEVVA